MFITEAGLQRYMYLGHPRPCRVQTDSHSMVKKYGIPLLVTADESLKEYLQTVLAQVQGKYHILLVLNSSGG